MFQIVLYYKRRTIIPPPKPSVEKMIDKNNPNDYKEYDDILDKYNNALGKYKKILNVYEEIKDNSIVESFVLIDDDNKFFEIIKEIENKEYFVEWREYSLDLIKDKKKERMQIL